MRTLFFTFLSCIATACSVDNAVVDEESFTIIVIPDTQNAVDFKRQKAEGFAIESSEVFIQQMEYIAGRSAAKGGDVVFVASVGDVWQHISSDKDPGHVMRGIESVQDPNSGYRQFIEPDGAHDYEIPKAIEGYKLVSEAGIPFGVAPGNHDYDAWWSVAVSAPIANRGESGTTSEAAPAELKVHLGGLNNFRTAFGSDTDFFRGKEWYVSGYEGGGSSAQVFSAGGYRFLHLAIEMQAGDNVIAWARDVVNEYAGLPTILSTHDFLNRHGERLPGGRMDLAIADPEAHNSAEELWQEFISTTDQVFMVLSGHQPGQATRIDENEFGHEVYQLLADYQVRGQAGLDANQSLDPAGGIMGIGDGWLREMSFHTRSEKPRVEVRTYSSHYESYSSDLKGYVEWYKEKEQPEMGDRQFLDEEDFTLELRDFRERFGMPLDR